MHVKIVLVLKAPIAMRTLVLRLLAALEADVSGQRVLQPVVLRAVRADEHLRQDRAVELVRTLLLLEKLLLAGVPRNVLLV